MSVESDILNTIKNYFTNNLDINESLSVIAIYLALDNEFDVIQIGDELTKFAEKMFKQGNYSDAKLYNQYIITLYDSYGNDFDLESIKIHRKLGDCFFKEENYCDANVEYKKAYDKVIANKSMFVQGEDIKAANYYLNLQFKSLEASQDYANAEKVMKISVQLLESQYKEKNNYLDLSDAYFKLGRINEQNNNFQVASTNYAKSIEILFMNPSFDYNQFCNLADKIAVCCSNYYDVSDLPSIEWFEFTINLLENYDIASKWFANISINSSKENNFLAAAEAKFLQAKCQIKKLSYFEAAINFEQAIDFYKKCDESYFEIVKLSKELGDCYCHLGKFNTAIDAYINFLEYYNKWLTNYQQLYFNKYNLALVHHQLGYCYFKVKNYENAIKYLLKSNDLFEDIENYSNDAINRSSCNDKPSPDVVQNIKYSLSASCHLLGDCYKQLHKYSEAKKFYLQSIEILKENENVDIYDDMGWAYLRLAQENNIITKVEAVKYYESALKYFEKNQNIIMKICTLGMLSLTLKKKSKSSEIFNQSYNEMKKLISFDHYLNENNMDEFFHKIKEYFTHNKVDGIKLKYFLSYLTSISQFFFYNNDFKSCEKYFLLLINWCLQQKSLDEMRLKEVYTLLGYTTFRERSFHQSIDYLLKCLNLNEPPTITANYLSLAYKELAHIEIDQKWVYLNEAEKCLRNYMSNNGKKCSDYEKAILNYHLAAIKLDKEEPTEALKLFNDASSVLKVNQESSISFDYKDTYIMHRSKNRGVCFICNNLSVNTNDLELLFNRLNYDVVIINNITIQLIDELKSCEQLVQYDVFVMIMFAFGNNEEIKLCDDSKAGIDSIAIQFFNNINCIYLCNKPKIFIYHTFYEHVFSHDDFNSSADNSDKYESNFDQFLGKKVNQISSEDMTDDPYLVPTSDIFIWNLVLREKSLKQYECIILDIIQESGKANELFELSKTCKPILSKYQISSYIKAIGWRKNFYFNLTPNQTMIYKNIVSPICEDKNCDQKSLCLIVENNLFDAYSFIIKANARQGSICDVNNIASKFLQLNYKVMLIRDKTAEEIKTFFKNFTEDETLINFESLIIFILSHGNKGGIIYGIDEEPVLIHRYILRPINECKYFIKKPKVIISQACRGEDDICNETDSTPSEDDKDNDIDDTLFSDMVIWHSTLEDYVSYRDIEFGSRFVSSLIQVIDDHNDNIELLDLVKKSNQLLMKKFSSKSKIQTSEVVMHGWHHNYYIKKQI